MKREIKFRAWIEETWNETDDYVEPMTIQQMIHSKESTFSLEQLNDLVDFEQFTGLTDANGREIYESDILKVTGEDGESYVATVKWFGDEDYPAFDLAGIPAAWNYDANALATILQSGVETCEVIGNIHEDKQLLEGKK
ncbi:YopX protein [Lacticaseibacillus paracasei]|uniref:YopX family protein n=1 Tax=Lacticaseibacillus paracasei TaxID=1597 RepID=UPI000F439886|nr:YopX family protein [Lacticaseibacillus paracasei]RND95680.1 YopX protein [Lacticaseibacillus paracasei]